MKIGILTWSQETNHGAVLQTYASQEVLKSKEVEPVILSYVANDSNMDNRFFKRIKRITQRFNINAIKTRSLLPSWNQEKKKLFDDYREKELILGEDYSKESGLDGVLIGSDMVFDVYEGYHPFMYGLGLKAKYIFSYAASFGYTTNAIFENFEHNKIIKESLGRFNGISHRDDNTYKVLSECCDITESTKCIDPVLLYGFEKELLIWDTAKWAKESYILIYSYTYNMDRKEEIDEIRKFAKSRNLQIISVGYIHLWCDKNINASPKEFLELFKYAKYVITDTYHGTIFSLTLNKQFAVLVRNNSFKICDILNDLNLNHLLSGGIKERVLKLVKNPIDYDKVNNRIRKLREESMKYLDTQIERIHESNDKK